MGTLVNLKTWILWHFTKLVTKIMYILAKIRKEEEKATEWKIILDRMNDVEKIDRANKELKRLLNQWADLETQKAKLMVMLEIYSLLEAKKTGVMEVYE